MANPEDLGFKSLSGCLLELFLGIHEFNSSDTLVKSHLVCLLPVGSFNTLMFNLNYFFMKFNAWPLCKVL